MNLKHLILSMEISIKVLAIKIMLYCNMVSGTRVLSNAPIGSNNILFCGLATHIIVWRRLKTSL